MRWRAIAVAVALVAGTAVPAVAEPGSIPATDREIRFVVDGTTAYGTVHVPAHRRGARLAAALLIPGSGPTDRNGNEPPTITPDTLRLIADQLGQDGVLTLRFDKYFTGTTGPGAYRDDPSRIDLPAFTRQALAAYDTLRRQPETDPHSLLIVGHSEGGLQALLVARQAHPRPSGLALLAPQDLRLLDLVRLQLDQQLDAAVQLGQLTEDQATANKTAVATAITDFRAGRPIDTTGLIPPLAAFLQSILGPVNARFVRSDDNIYPPDVARQVRAGTRVTVTCGTADVQVPCETTGPFVTALRKAHVSGPGLVTLDGIDHFLHPAGTPINTQILAPAAQTALHAFTHPYRHP